MGIYLHIPFCKTRCAYCDFFSTTQSELRDAYVEAIAEELKVRLKDATETVGTIYFGGGTPSLLTVEQIAYLLSSIRQLAHVEADAEITLEANPGDLSEAYLAGLRQAGINRLSIGIQSMHDDLLRLIGRRHTATEAKEAVRLAKEAGFDNISVDLIYGLPTQTMSIWQADIDEILRLDIQHISAYCLSYEEGTRLTNMRDKGEVAEVDEDVQLDMYDMLIDRLQAHGFQHYEVSNFALSGKHSRHNSSYWNNTPYVGVGAGAHSYDGKTRMWWQGQLKQYIADAMAHTLQYESEVLTEADLYNERVMLSLRTNAGLDLIPYTPEQRQELLMAARPHLDMGLLTLVDGRLKATREGIHLLNRIIEDLMI